ncbi:MAG: serine/threonine-protein kinase [Planctomycetota bacterium]
MSAKQPVTTLDSVGKRVGAYRLVSELGAGGMGTVYLAVVQGPAPGLQVGQKVAVKILHPHLLAKPGVFKRFLREAELGKVVSHPNVVRTFDADAITVGGKSAHHLVMEYVEGQTLRSLLRELGRVPEELCRHIAREAAKALVAIHAVGIIHRDLKPENILITDDYVLKVMDLGIARLVDEEFRLSLAGGFVGSVLYGAPEQFECGTAELDGRADLYTLGLALYELVTGKHPFAAEEGEVVIGRQHHEEARPAGELNPQISPFFEEVLKTLLANDREQRFPSAAELLEVLQLGEQSAWWKARARAIRASTKRPLRRVRVPRETALYGRDEDLARLRTLYEKAQAGEGQVLLLEGEAGIGKTRLVDEFFARLLGRSDEVNLLFGSYPPGGAATAATAFAKAYRNHFGEENLEETLHDYLTITPGLIPSFAALLKGETTPKGEEALTKDSLQTVFVHATRALAQERPTVVVIDDLHFTPAEGRALFASLALAVPGHRILLVGTSRPGLPQDWVAGVERQVHSTRLTLARLGFKDLAGLLIEAFGSESLAEELAFGIGTKSDGNPLFALEIIRGLREGRFIAQQADGTWAKTRVIERIRIPSSVRELIQARIADLEEEDKDLLDVSACCGHEFDPGLVADAVGMSRVPVLKRLGRIERKHRLIRSAGLTFVFDHHQIQAALYEGLPGMLRQEYHAAIAQALETREQAGKDPYDLEGGVAAEICRHFLEGARGKKALVYLEPALDYLEKNYLNDSAIRLADRALSLRGLLAGRDRINVLLRKVDRLDLLGRQDEERGALEEALALADGLGDPALRSRARRALGAHLIRISEYAGARGWLEQALDIARAAGDRRAEASSIGNLGVVLVHLGRYEEAREHHERALALHRETGNRRGEARATNNLEFVFGRLGRYAEARWHYERALSLAREIGYRRGEARATNNLGSAFGRLGWHEEARRHHDLALALAREIGYRRGEGWALHGLGIVEEAVGDPDEATRLYQEARDLRREVGDRHGLANTLVALGRHLTARGREESAAKHLDEALALGRELKAPATIILAAAQRALSSGGDARVALEAFAEHEARIGHGSKMVARFLLWQATRDPAHLAEAHRLLVYLREHAPVKFRETMIEKVPVHRDIMAAWRAHADA